MPAGTSVLPGLINTHHHFYQTLTTRQPRRAGPNAVSLAAGAVSDLGATDAGRAGRRRNSRDGGASAVRLHDDHRPPLRFSRRTGSRDRYRDRGRKRLGLRVVLTRGSMNLSQRDGGLPPGQRRAGRRHDPGRQRAADRALPRRTPGAMVQVALAPCSPFSVTTSLMSATAALAAQAGVRLHTHLAETADEEAFCLATFGCRPLDYLDQCGWLHDRTWLAHGIHFNSGEISRLAKAGTCVTHCPCSNQILASGTCRVCEMEQAGMHVGLGVDGSASNNASNMMQEVRAAFLLQRGRYGVEQVSHRDALRWATEGSAACIGRPELGPHRCWDAGGPGAVHAGRTALFRRAWTRSRPWWYAAPTAPTG